jgi:hAT family C-terminal dimerisation region
MSANPVPLAQGDAISVTMMIRNELKLYDDMPESAIETSPFVRWNKNSGFFKYLSILAKKYLFIAATIVASERVFTLQYFRKRCECQWEQT